MPAIGARLFPNQNLLQFHADRGGEVGAMSPTPRFRQRFGAIINVNQHVSQRVFYETQVNKRGFFS